MGQTYDAIIVGARVAGAATAMLLARKGYRVLLLDRTRFPADIPHGHLVHRDGPRRLRDWGVLERLLDAGTPPVAQVTTHFGDFPLTATDLIVDGVAWGYGARRRVLDQLLLEAAVAAGAELREGFTVEDVVTDGDRVNGITGRAGETRITERAAITIGADGRRSHIARLVGAAEYDSVPTLLCYYFSYWSGVAADGMEIHHLAGRAAFAHPTTDGRYGVFIAWPIAEFQQVRSDIERHFAAAAMGFGTLGERLSAGRREEKFYGAADLPNVRRKPFGPGWALVGDAGYHKDPYMALGISDALRDAELLTNAIDDGLTGRRPIDEGLADYERSRNAASAADFHENIALARLQPPPPQLMALRAALRGDPEQTRRFWMARVGLIPREDFFNEANLARLMGARAGSAGPASA